MKFSRHWLHTWAHDPFSTEQLIQRLTMAGLEVESVSPVAKTCQQVIVGEIIAVSPHPHAEKLTLCQVTVGSDLPLQIICGANNVRVGLRVATAVAGAQISERLIETTELRGLQSEGMLCSAEELGLADSSIGILELPSTAPLGMELCDYLQLDDVSLELSLTPNRGDCLSIRGLAREVAVLAHTVCTPPEYEVVVPTIDTTIPVIIQASAACPRYLGRVIQNVNVQAPSPIWLVERLRRSGLRTINALVDVTNYVMLEWGQPLHAFDLASLSGGIEVRLATDQEQLTLLDGQTVTLDAQTLVIADQQQPLALAGIMGGLHSAVQDSTQHIFLESAFFSPQPLAGTARRYGLQTDAAYRFERGVDPHLQDQALERATALILAIAGGQAGPKQAVVVPEALPEIPTLVLRSARVTRILGQEVPAAQIVDILTRLGMNPIPQAVWEGGHAVWQWQVTPPSYRFDIRQEIDLIEEIARIYGYEQLPSRAPQATLSMDPQPWLTVQHLRNVLVHRGYQEAITYSFVDPQLQQQLAPQVPLLSLANPIASTLAVMRSTLWAGLLPAVLYNQQRQQPRVRLFEVSLCFMQTPQGLQQQPMIAGVATGSRWPEQWGVINQPLDFFDLKADVEALLTPSSHLANLQYQPALHPALHPGQAAVIYRGEEEVGVLGALHPEIIQRLDLLPPVYLFELQLDLLLNYTLPKFKAVSKYPSVRRDIAILINAQTSAEQVISCIRNRASDCLMELNLFDVYQGETIPPGKKSLAISLLFQAASRNLRESEVETEVQEVLNTLEQSLGAQLRK